MYDLSGEAICPLDDVALFTDTTADTSAKDQAEDCLDPLARAAICLGQRKAFASIGNLNGLS